MFGEDANVLGNARFYYEPGNAPNMTTSGLRQAWVAASDTMIAAKGYICSGGATVSFTGIPGNAPTGNPITINVTKPQLASAEYNPWNLIGNPFLCALNAEEFQNVNGPAGTGVITGALYFWDDDFSGGSGWASGEDYAVYNLTGVNPRFEPSLQLTSFTGLVASGQSFFVEKVNTGAHAVTITNAMRSNGGNNNFFRRQGMQRIYLGTITPNNIYNEALIAFSSFTTDGYDIGFDSRKLKGNSEIAFGSKLNGELYAIQAFGSLDDKIIPLGLDVAVSGNYQMRLMGIEDIDVTVVILLEDIALGLFHNFRMDSVYEYFTAASPDINRFFLHFNAPLEIETVDEGCSGNDGQIILYQAGTKTWNYEIEDMHGQPLASGTGLNGSLTVGQLTAGSYTLTLSDAGNYQVVKTIDVRAKQRVTADFQPVPVSFVNHPVQFTNLSSGAAYYEWDFGDGSPVESAQHPAHVYSEPGQYDVMMEAANHDCNAFAFGTVTVTPDVATGSFDTEEELVEIYGYDQTVVVAFEKPIERVFDLEIWNAVGQRIMAKSGISGMELRHQFMLKGIPSGSYYARLRSPEVQITKPVVLISD